MWVPGGFPQGSWSTFVPSLSVSPSLLLQCLLWVQSSLSRLGCDQMTNSQSPGRRAEGHQKCSVSGSPACGGRGEAQPSPAPDLCSRHSLRPNLLVPFLKLFLNKNVTCPSSGHKGRPPRRGTESGHWVRTAPHGGCRHPHVTPPSVFHTRV